MIVNRDELKQYLLALVASADIFLLLSLYLWLRRGYYNLYIANKASGSTALIILGVVLLVGPLCRLYQRFDPWMAYRKELGIVALVFALLHGTVSLFLLPQYFPTAYFLGQGLLTFLLGLAAVVIMAGLFITSLERVSAWIDKQTWWKLQYRGVRLAGLLALAHEVIMKYPGWLKWYASGGGEELARPYLPPGSVLAGSFGITVLLVRLAELLGTKVARVVIPLLAVLLLGFWTGSLVWGKAKNPRPSPISWEVCLKLPGSVTLETSPRLCISPDSRRVAEPSRRQF